VGSRAPPGCSALVRCGYWATTSGGHERLERDELHIREYGAGLQRHRVAHTLAAPRVGRQAEQVAGATGGQDDGAAAHVEDGAGPGEQRGAADHPAVLGEQLGQQAALDPVGCRCHAVVDLLDQRARDSDADHALGVDGPRPRAAGGLPAGQALTVTDERHSEVGQVPDLRAHALGDRGQQGGVVDIPARFDHVVEQACWGVGIGVPESGIQAADPIRRATRAAEEQHPSARALGPVGGHQPTDSAPGDQHIDLDQLGHPSLRRGQFRWWLATIIQSAAYRATYRAKLTVSNPQLTNPPRTDWGRDNQESARIQSTGVNS
jgi:hypothetical protein